MLCPDCKKDTVNMVYNPKCFTKIEDEDTILQCENCLTHWTKQEYLEECNNVFNIKGVSGKELLNFIGTITPEEGKELLEIIEKGCENIDYSEENVSIKIDKSKLGSMEYGEMIARQLKELYINQTITNVSYDYFSEGFIITLSNGETIHFNV